MTRVASSVLLALVLVAASAADGAGPTAYSGTVVTIDSQEGVLILDEIGPWRVEQGKTVTNRRTIQVTAGTTFNRFIRVNVPGAFAGDFLEVALDADDVTPGDFVTAQCIDERGRLVALRVTVAEVN